MAKFKALHFALWQGLLYFCNSLHKNFLTTQKFAYHTKLTIAQNSLITAHKAFAFDDKHSLNLRF